jgi:glutamate--cysteine ligase
MTSDADEELSLEQARKLGRAVCFKTGPPGNAGVELEWLVLDRTQPHRPVPPERLNAALASLPATDGRLPSGTLLTREPGGQLELSTSCAPGPLACVTTAADDLALVRRPATSRAFICLATAWTPSVIRREC